MSELLQQEIQHLQQQIRIGKQAAPQCLQAFVDFVDEAALTQSLTTELNPLWAACQPVLASLNDPFYWLVLGEDAYLYERQHQRLWYLPTCVYDEFLYKDRHAAATALRAKPHVQGQAWQLPSVGAMVSFAQTPENPMRQGSNARLFGQCYWLTAAGRINLDDSQPSPRDIGYGYCLGMIRITWDVLLRLGQQQEGRLIANTPDLTRQLHTHYRPSSSTPAAFVQGLKQAPCALQASAAFRALDAWYHKIPVRVAHQIGAQIGRQVQQQVRRLPASLQPLLHPKTLVTTLMAEVVPVIKARHAQLAQAPQQAFYWLVQVIKARHAQLAQAPQQAFYWLVQADKVFLLEARTHWVWQIPRDLEALDTEAAQARLSQDTGVEAHQRWQLPSADELHTFAQTPNNPMRHGRNIRLLNQGYWLTAAGRIHLYDEFADPTKDGKGPYLGVIKAYGQHTWADLLALCADKGWRLVAASPVSTETQEALHGGDTPNLAQLQQSLQDLPNNADLPDLPDFDQQIPARVRALVMQSLTHLDAEISPLPELEPADLTDPTKGLWELWGTPAEELAALGVRARNPTQDVQAWPVAIDFGTSSTVVAYREGGKKRLLRVGVKDFYSPVQAEHFENPTLLEIVDWQALCTPWQQVAYRPPVRWGDVRASHEALASLRDNENEVGVVASILTKLKHWALHQSDQNLVILQDRARQQEIILPKLTLRNPVKGQALSVSEQDPFDPIELYAYFLGLSINWRQRGIFLQYYMTFPVAYPQVVKDNILASFRRGLQRSLPASLVNQPAFDTFCVQERASEPAAFAVAALPFHGIEPTLEGVSYAVFDFGGGTTDFDFGVYREPTPEEEDQGYEFVFEHFGAAGDKFLGGENLLEHLAYLVFKENEASLRQEQIVITCPLDAEPFLGAEMLIASTQTARTNTQVLIGRLRAFWEEGKQSQQGLVKVKLVKRTGESKHLELAVDYEKLEAYLQKRLYEGAEKFLLAMQQAWLDQAHEPEKVHVLLAGNASRSRYLLPAFARAQENYPALPELILHGPITTQETQPDQVTTKTGVALGLLDLCPGARTLVINHACIQAGGEAPFPYYVGRIKRRYFQPVLKPNTPYQQWQEIGIVIDDHFELVYSRSPLANTGQLPQDANELHFLPLNFYQADRQRVFARALTPDTLEVCSALNREAIEEDHAQARALANLQRLTLHK